MMLAIALLASMLAVGAWYAVHRNQRRQRQRELQARFDELRGGIAETALQLDELTETARRDIELVRGSLAAPEDTEALGDAPQVLARAEELLQRRTELVKPALDRQHPGDTSPDGLEPWRDYGEHLRAVYAELRAEEQRLTTELAAAEQVPDQLKQAHELVREVRAALGRGEAAGYTVSTEANTADIAAERLEEVERLVAECLLRSAHANLVELIRDLSATRDDLNALRRRSAEVETRLAELAKSLDAVDTRGQEAAACQATLTEQCAPGVWAGLAEYLAEGGKHAEQARAELDRARRALDAGDPGQAESVLPEIDDHRARAEAAYAVPIERQATVQRLRESLPGTREEVRSRLARAEGIAEEDEALHPMSRVLAELHRQVDAVDLTVDKPEWLLCEWRLAEIDTLVTPLTELGSHALRTVRDVRTELDRARAAREEAREAQRAAEVELAWHLNGRRRPRWNE
ncbi:hypothetical protein [Lipingzhangella rawalii]|uniref:hypothetical protein n=1 Tax=Lipingzhangella rawalii TaxID=2055835 RepID=UPI00287B9E6F|nr:hypothetical protein [Lipingzhangella rawalii]